MYIYIHKQKSKISTVMWLWANIEHHEETVSKHKYLRLKSWVFQNISKEFLSAASKNQAKIQSRSADCLWGRGTKNEELRK